MNPAPMPFVTALYAGLVALLLLALALRVSRFRMRTQVGIGDDGSPAFRRAIRAHANALEWSLPVLLLLLVAELCRASPVLLHAAGIALLAGRVLHGVGLSAHSGYSFGRFAGTGLTWLVLLVLAHYHIVAFLRAAAA
jgi:uncharacterized membrane protein YecN with MAPEG domain